MWLLPLLGSSLLGLQASHGLAESLFSSEAQPTDKERDSNLTVDSESGVRLILHHLTIWLPPQFFTNFRVLKENLCKLDRDF